jgi:hypothetical protein
MAIESSQKPPQHESDYHGAWKEALRLHLAVFVRKYFPKENAAIDWSHEPEWFDKELSIVLALAGERLPEAPVHVLKHAVKLDAKPLFQISAELRHPIDESKDRTYFISIIP